jgi:hypothetical protein
MSHQRQPRAARMVLSLSMLACCTLAFQLTPRLHPNQRIYSTARPMAALDPTDLVHAVSSAIHTHQHSADAAAASTSSLETILSTMYTTTVDFVYKGPAHGHSNPWFGPPDPYLVGDKPHSIAPNLKALGIADGTVATQPTELPDIAKKAAEKGFKIIDPAALQAKGGGILPGFRPTGGILPHGNPNIPHGPGSISTIYQQGSNNEKLLKAIQSMMLPAALYAAVDMAFLRPGVYKEDIEDDPVGVTVETFQVLGVRLGVFTAMAVVALAFFSG